MYICNFLELYVGYFIIILFNFYNLFWIKWWWLFFNILLRRVVVLDFRFFFVLIGLLRIMYCLLLVLYDGYFGMFFLFGLFKKWWKKIYSKLKIRYKGCLKK